jgi:hypothetical protein
LHCINSVKLIQAARTNENETDARTKRKYFTKYNLLWHTESHNNHLNIDFNSSG